MNNVTPKNMWHCVSCQYIELFFQVYCISFKKTYFKSCCLFQTLLLSDLRDHVSGAPPYMKTLIVKVITQGNWTDYQTVGGFNTKKLSAQLADKTTFKKSLVFGEKFRPLFQPGRTLAIKNFIYKDGVLRILNKSMVAR